MTMLGICGLVAFAAAFTAFGFLVGASHWFVRGADAAIDLIAKDNAIRLRVLGIDPKTWIAAAPDQIPGGQVRP